MEEHLHRIEKLLLVQSFQLQDLVAAVMFLQIQAVKDPEQRAMLEKFLTERGMGARKFLDDSAKTLIAKWEAEKSASAADLEEMRQMLEAEKSRDSLGFKPK